MAKIEYVSKQFSASSLLTIQQANEIIEDYQEQGFTLTLRQLYYQFVARDLIPNKQREYSRLSGVISDARLAGIIDWNAIEDRTRFLRKLSHWDSVSEIIRSCVYSFRLNKWKNQEYRPEVWIEKDALIGIIEGVCDEYDIPHFSCRGYTSQSEMHNAAKRLEQYTEDGKKPIIFHFGDHDPSGIDMTNDIMNRMEIFGINVEVRRLALNMDQVEQYNPPPNPAKLSDSRFQKYMEKYDTENSWELDALEPKVIEQIIKEYIVPLIDQNLLHETLIIQKKGKEQLKNLAAEVE